MDNQVKYLDYPFRGNINKCVQDFIEHVGLIDLYPDIRVGEFLAFTSVVGIHDDSKVGLKDLELCI